MMTPAGFKFVVGLLASAVIAITVSYFWQDYINAKRNEQLAADRKETAEGTVATIDDAAVSRAVAAEISRMLQTNRTVFTDNQTKAKADDPKIAERAVVAVPKRVRDNFKERRLARERSACVSGQCADGDAADPAAER